uniref:Tetratricopeptide repeat protein n=1 Tax=Schlesneria paludicola TaxID=360056 RepID=A0A7C4LJ12_9PLAN
MSATPLSALLEQARAAVRSRDYAAAIAHYRQALTVDPESVDALEGLAMMLLATGSYAAAVEQFQRLVLLQPMEARHYINMGAAYNRLGQYQKAVDTLRKGIQRNRKCADAYYNLGIAQRKLNMPSLAISAYKEAIRLDPQLVEAYQNLGNLYTEMGNYQLALANYRKALELRPDFEKARLGLEKAEEAIQRSKASANPFGRLVNTSSVAPKSVPIVTRELSDADREFDRQRVRLLCEELQRLTADCLAQLKNKLEAGILDVQRSAAEGQFKNLGFVGAANEFQDAFRNWLELRQQLKRKALELRAHEELINTPQMPPSP